MPEPIIRVENLRFSWRRQTTPVLDLPEFAVAAGERLFIQGPSGSGKTTLLSLLGGVITPQQGEVVMLNTPLSTLSRAARDRFRADHVGFVFQMFNLIPYLSLPDNVALPCRFSARRRARATAAGRSLAAEAVRLLNQLGLRDPELRARPVTDLSVGQQQRVAVARALIGGPEVLIADEPTSALDADTREAFLKLLFAECERAGATLLFVSHDAGLARLFSRSVRLDQLNRADAAAPHDLADAGPPVRAVSAEARGG